MAKKGSRDQSYDVGYGKPPRATQYKPGQSGNPRGRRRPDHSILDLIREKGERPVTVVIGNQKRRMTQREYLVELTFQRANKSDWRALRWLLDNSVPARNADLDEQGIPLVKAPKGNGSRVVQFELAEDELPLIEKLRDDLAKYKGPEGAEENPNIDDEDTMDD